MRALFPALVLLAAAAWAGNPKVASKPADDEDPPRTVARLYELRAYAGAPPVYSHPVEEDVESTPDACLSCHKRGTGDAPVTPHPEQPECRQCHVFRKTTTLFRPTTWTALAPPVLGRKALFTSPPVMPHAATGFRARCGVCHGPKNPAKELKSPHPERGACVQCHVPAQTSAEWSRPAP